jgi:sugar-phosphatase
MSRLRAVIFDMDGLLVDSEFLWREAEIEVFGRLGVALDEQSCAETTGLRVDRVVDHWYERYPWDGAGHDEVVEGLVVRVTALLAERAELRPGVYHALDLVQRHRLAVALASSSARRIIDATLGHVGLADAFAVVLSGDEVPEAKPHPVIYRETAERLGVAPQQCLVLEDSLVGVTAAKAAGMRCIAVPEVWTDDAPARFAAADEVLRSLADLDDARLEPAV